MQKRMYTPLMCDTETPRVNIGYVKVRQIKTQNGLMNLVTWLYQHKILSKKDDY